MEYAYMVAGVVIYFFVAVSEWVSAGKNSKSPFLHAAFWPVWLAVYVMILGVMAAIAVVWFFVTFFAEMYNAFKWYREDA